LNNNNISSSSAQPQVEIPVGVIDHPSIVKSPKTIEESSIFSDKVIFRALIFQFEILFSKVSIVLIVGLVETIVKLSEF
jgi:hypothetical protein